MRHTAVDGDTNQHPGTEMISVRLNGEKREVTGGSVVDLLASLDIDPRTVVVELNREIVRRPSMESTYIKEGDEIELVHFVGGG